MAEEIEDTKLLYCEGMARTTVAGGNIKGNFDGLMRLYEDASQLFKPNALTLDCRAADHGIEFVRR